MEFFSKLIRLSSLQLSSKTKLWLPSPRFLSLSHLSSYTESKFETETPSSNPSLHVSPKLRRFWKQASVQSTKEGHQIYLDHRPLKTPKGFILAIPHEKSLAAWMIAHEWQSQPEYFKYGSFPLTSLFVRAQDDLMNVQHRKEVIEKLIPFLHTDTICYPQSYPESLVELQKKHWDPILSWCKSQFQVQLQVSNGLLDYEQPATTVSMLEQLVTKLSPLDLACFEACTLATKSFLISLALLHQQLSAQSAVDAARIEVTSQSMKWGEIEEAHGLDLELMQRQVAACAVALQ